MCSEIYKRPHPEKLSVVGLYKDMQGNVCFNVGTKLITISEHGVNAYVRLLVPGDKCWCVSQEILCRTHDEMCDVFLRTVEAARA